MVPVHFQGRVPGASTTMSERHPGPSAASGRPTLHDLAAAAERLVRARYAPPRVRGREAILARHADALADLSERFTSDRGALPRGYLDRPPIRAAYLLYFLATGAATAGAVLRLAGIEPRPGNGPLRVLDLGAGPLSASLGVALALPGRDLDIVALDASPSVMADGAELMAELFPRNKVVTRRVDLRDRGALRNLGGRFDLVLAANVINELPAAGGRGGNPALQLVQTLLTDALTANGRVVLWEPGTRMASSRLVSLRERVHDSDMGRVLAPCTGAPTCPFSHPRADGWCHAEQSWKRPPVVAALDRAIGHRRASLKFSWLVLGGADDSAPEPGGWRVIGGPMHARGVFRRYLCGPKGRVVANADDRRLPRDHPLRLSWRGEWLADLGRTRAERGRRGERVLRLLGGKGRD